MADCRTRIQILKEKCILRIHLSSDYLQILGRKQTDGPIQKSGVDPKGLSAIESNSNLEKLCSKTILSRAKIFCVSE